MQHFTITFGRAWWGRIVGRNPLVRRSDRVAAWTSIVATLIIATAAPIVGAVATSMHDLRSQEYAERAHSSHQVTATALEDGTVVLGPGPAGVSFVVHAGWRFGGRDYSDVVEWPSRAKAGEKQEIWVDDQGQQVQRPPSPDSADNDAVGFGFALWFAVIAFTVGIAYLVLWRVDRQRDAEWERDLATLHHQA